MKNEHIKDFILLINQQEPQTHVRAGSKGGKATQSYGAKGLNCKSRQNLFRGMWELVSSNSVLNRKEVQRSSKTTNRLRVGHLEGHMRANAKFFNELRLFPTRPHRKGREPTPVFQYLCCAHLYSSRIQ